MARKGDRMMAQNRGSGLARALFVRRILGPIIRHYVHPAVSGLENLSGQAPPLILAANHCSHMDTPLVLNSLPGTLRRRTLVVAAADYFFAGRPLALFVSIAVGAVPVDRQVATGRDLAAIHRLLTQGWNVLLYPEGGRSPDGRLHKGRTGVARLALSAHVPVIPVGITGTYHAMPRGRSWPISWPAEVHFGKPLSFERMKAGVADQATLRAVTDEIMHEIIDLTGLSYVDEYASDTHGKPPG